MADRTKLIYSVAKGFAKYAVSACTGLDSSVLDSVEDFADKLYDSLQPELSYKDARVLAMEYGTITDAFYVNIERFHHDRSAERQFETIFLSGRGKLGSELSPSERRELSSYIDAEFEAALIAVRQGVNAISITVEEMVDLRFDSAAIERRILVANRPNARDLGSPVKELYEATVRDCCQLLVGLSSTMPEFNILVARSLLKNQDVISNKIDALGEQIRALIPTEEGEESRHHAGFTSRLKLSIASQLQEIEQFGVPGHLASSKYDISTAFVELDAQVIKGGSGESTLSEILPVLASETKFFIRGEAGTGKTTVLQWIALMSATASMTGDLRFYNDKIPVFVRLRSVQIEKLLGSSLLDHISPILRDREPAGWQEKCLEDRRFLFLLDGVDEVALEHRESVRTWLEQMMVLHPDQYFFITSRPSAVHERWLQGLKFTVVNVRPMSEQKIHTFVERWHQAVRNSPLLDYQPEKVAECQRRVVAAISGSREVRALASYPLLAALLCSMNFELGGQLPRSRMEFYRAAVDMLLANRDKAANVTASSIEGLDIGQRRRLMQQLAFWMTQNRTAEARISGAKQCIGRSLEHFPRLDSSQDETYAFLLERSGLLREPSAEMVEFVHKSFQEFLASWEYQAQDYVNYLASNAHADDFRDTFVLAVGHSPVVRREQILEALVRRFYEEAGATRRDIGLALAASLEVCESLSPAMQRKVLDAIRDIAPPRDFFEAVHFSHALEADLQLLDGIDIGEPGEAASSVSALCLTGRSGAIEVVRRFCSSSEPQVVEALLAGAEHFPKSDYPSKVFPLINFTGSAVITDGLVRFIGTERLDISIQIPALSNLDLFASMPGLLSVTVLQSSRLYDISALRRCENLKELSVSHCPALSTLGSVTTHPSLQTLIIGEGVSLDEDPALAERPHGLLPLQVRSARVGHLDRL